MKLNTLLPVVIISIISAGNISFIYAASDNMEGKYILNESNNSRSMNETLVNDEPKKEKYKYVLESNVNEKPLENNPPVRTAENKGNPDVKRTINPDLSAYDFVENRGVLPWPVNNGFISGTFGRYTHPLEPKVTLENSGINITVKAASQIRSVFQGTVCRIEKIAGTFTVIVNHGEYYTVYSYLSSTNVKVGDRVGTKQNLGLAGKNDDGIDMLHFEVCKIDARKNLTHENPGIWINQLQKN